MKKVFLMLAVAATATLGLTSCEKIEDALFKPFDSPLSFEVTIPVVSNTTDETEMGQTVVNYDLEKVIRDNTGNAFGADIIGAMYIKDVAIQLLESDANNDLSNFDYVKLSVAAGSAPAVMGPFNIPASATTSASFAVTPRVNILPFFSGSNVTFKMTGKANTATTRTLRARVSATITFEK
jgi:hypothetical protein